MGLSMEAWVTTALSEEEAKKAIVLAGSLRRVQTGKKLVVFIAPNGKLSRELRNKLGYLFDQVSVLEPPRNPEVDEEEWGKMAALNLTLAKKCVYLSPNTLVLKNCDDIFETKATFAASISLNAKNQKQGPENVSRKWDTTVWLLTPNATYLQAVNDLGNSSGEPMSNIFLKWIEAQGLDVVKLDEKYNTKLDLKADEGNESSLDAGIRIANFGLLDHPINMMPKDWNTSMGPPEMFALTLWRELYKEHFTGRNLNSGILPEKYEREPIAIVGMSFRLPNANDVKELWEMFVEGKEGIRPLPEHRWTKQRTMYPCNSRKVEAGFLSVPIDQFDAKFFGISPKDAEYLDPQQRLLHEISWEALEDASIDPLSLYGTQTSIFIGSWIYDYQSFVWSNPDLDFLRSYMGNSVASSAARLSHFYGTTGLSLGTESGCSAGIAAIDMGVKSLRSGMSNLALAGGVNLILHPFDKSKMSVVLAPDGRCKTFDSKADGFGRAEGCAVLVMKRLSDAVRDEDNIWGLLRGSAMTQEGTSKSMGTPTVHSESLAMELALQDAGVNPLEISYIETHGTGTPVGDPMEIAAITKAYSKGRTEPVLIGSVKTNLGHTESVSGITGLIKVLLSMKNEMIPKHLNLEKLNPAINLSLIPAEIPLENVPWPKKSISRRYAGVSSFGISGTDAHLIVEEPPELKQTEPILCSSVRDRPLHILKVSAKTPESLQELLKKYQQVLSENVNFPNFAFSANTGRSNFSHRAVVIAKDSSDAVRIIEEKSYLEANVQSTGEKLCFLFTGQGSQYPNMAKNLYETSPVFQFHFDKCDQILESKYKISLKPVLWSDSSNLDELSRTLYSQTSIFVVEYCLLKLWESYGVKPDYVFGHSLGEFAAAVAAGALTFRDALTLVAERSRLIDSLPRGKMLVIRADKKTVDEAIHSYQQNNRYFWVDYAAINAPDQTVVAGDSEMIQEFAKFCKTRSLKTIMLAATHAFHSRHMDPMLEQYRRVASSITRPTPKDSAPRYISGMEGRLIETNSIDAGYWVRHTREMVRFTDACKSIQSEGCTLFLEVGPHPVLSALTMANIEERVTCLPSLHRKEDEWSTLLGTLAKLYLSGWGGQVNWKGLDRFYERKRVPVPFYQFNRKPIWTNFQRHQADLHPLLGKILPTASNDAIFQNIITPKKLPYVEDHVIGNTVIFPGAGYLEMCLAGGVAASQSLSENLIRPRRPVLLKNVTMTAPLAIYDQGMRHLQTTISSCSESSKEGLEYHVRIHRKLDPEEIHGEGETQIDGGEHWALHSTATFVPLASQLPEEISLAEGFDLNEIPKSSSWENKNASIQEFYTAALDVGLRFGPKFHSLQNGWANGPDIIAKINVPDDYKNYMVHPIVVDAMFQGIMIWKEHRQGGHSKLEVPFHIGQFIWLKEATSPNQYAFCSESKENGVFVVLLDQDGSALAYMNKVELLTTTTKLIEGAVNHNKNHGMPNLWKEVWKSSSGPLQNCFDMKSLIKIEYNQETQEILREANEFGLKEGKFHENIVKLTGVFVLQAMYKLGWKPSSEEAFTPNQLCISLGVHSSNEKYLQFFLRQFCQYFDLKELPDPSGGVAFKFSKLPPIAKDVEEMIINIMRQMEDQNERMDYRLILNVGRNLAEVLTREKQGLAILFPEDPSEPSAGAFYDSLRPWANKARDITIYGTLEKVYSIAMEKHQETYGSSTSTGASPVLRILEIGAGTGTVTKSFLDFFKAKGIKHKYHFTDISYAFFLPAEKLLKDHLDNVVFEKFDMEKDPLEQGFQPKYFDVVIAFELLHISENVNCTLGNIRSLLKPGGVLLISDQMVLDPRLLFCFGLLEGFWRCKDREYPILSEEMWKESLAQAGFERVTITPYYNHIHGAMAAFASLEENTQVSLDFQPKTNCWLVFSEGTEFTQMIVQQLQGVNRDVIILSKVGQDLNLKSEEETKAIITSKFKECFMNGKRLEGILYLWGLSLTKSVEEGTLKNLWMEDQAEISLPFISLCQVVAGAFSAKEMPNIFVVTQGLTTVDPAEVSNPNPGTLAGIVRALSNEDPSLKIRHFDLPPGSNKVDHHMVLRAHEIFLNFWGDRVNERVVAFRNGNRLIPKLVSATFENHEPLSLPSGCDRFQLVLPPTRMISDLEYSYLEPYILQDFEVEVKVHAVALNFRDVFTVLKPIKEFVDFNSVGLEVSGTVVRCGAKVTKRKLGDRVVGFNFDKDLSMPSHIKVDENMLAPLPPHLTMVEGATLPVVFSTVVHSLIHMAQMKKGETVLIHTASGGVGLCAIQLAQYFGVNIVATAGSPKKRRYLRDLGIKHIFNSRTTHFGKQILEVTQGQGVDIVLNSLTGEGFKEASLGALAKNGRFIEMSALQVWTPEEVKAQRPDVFYHIVRVVSFSKEEMVKLCGTLEHYFKQEIIKPIAHECFDALNIRGALNHLQKAKHIGKIICMMPDVNLTNSRKKISAKFYNEESTYLVTGGLGGIGFQVVKRMLEQGAKHVAILSRSMPNAEVATQIESWNKSGKHVEAYSVNVGDFQQLKNLFRELSSASSKFPKIRGVMHAAGVLKDSLLGNQNWSKFRETYNAKVHGTWNLHELTKDMDLEHFVLFSSIAAQIGSPGQTNHSASNAFLDAFASFRRSSGLPATSINWGNWGEVGVAAELDLPGILPLSTNQSLLAMETFLKTQTPQLTVLNVESFKMAISFFPHLKYYVEDSRLFNETKTAVIVNSDDFWKELDSCSDTKGKSEVFKKYIKITSRSILKMSPDEVLDDQAEFQSLGIDSLMMLEMRNAMQNILGNRLTLTVNQLKDCNNTEQLAQRLVEVLAGEEDSKKLDETGGENLKRLIHEDCNIMPVIDPATEAKLVSDIKSVLVTGATGNIGPYILRDLSQIPEIQQIHCLVRPANNVPGIQRLQQRLEQLSLLEDVQIEKLFCVEGDITKDNLGLDEKEYDELTRSIDAVLHFAGVVHFDSEYSKKESSIRNVNVLGTINVLEFAGKGTLKHVLFPSSLSSLVETDGDGNLSENFQSVGAFDQIKSNLGYAVSKHVSEQIIRNVMERHHLPCKIFRYPYIGGDSKTGRVGLSNELLLRWVTLLRLGCMPDLPIPIGAVAVDRTSAVTLEAFLSPNVPPGVYHIMNELEMEQELIPIAAELGINVEAVPYAKFKSKLDQLAKEEPQVDKIRRIWEALETVFMDDVDSKGVQTLKIYYEKGGQIVSKLKLNGLLPDSGLSSLETMRDVMRRDLMYLRDSGTFKQYNF